MNIIKMKRRKILKTLFVAPILFSGFLVFSCSNNNSIESVKSDKEIVNEYVQNLNPTIKKDK